jgi:SAM-dependent methyltransferase
MASDQWEQYYRQVHKKFPEPLHYSIRDWTKFSILENYIPDSYKKAGLRHLDVGAGRGKCLGIYGWKSTGIELCDDHYAYNKYFLKTDIRQTHSITDSSFDVITSFNSLNFHPNPRKMLEDYRDKLSKDGILFLSVPVLDHLYVDVLQNYYALPIYSFFTIKTIHALLDSVGFDVVMSTEKLKEYTLIVKRGKQKDLARNFDNSAMLIDLFNRTRTAIIPAMAMDRDAKAAENKPSRKVAWKNVMETNPNFVEGLLGYANVHLDQFGEVFQLIQEGLKKWPDNGILLLQVASLFRMHGMLDESLDNFIKVKKMFWCYDLFVGMAACYYDKGLFLDAMENYDTAVHINPMHASDGVHNLLKKIEACCIAIKG